MYGINGKNNVKTTGTVMAIIITTAMVIIAGKYHLTRQLKDRYPPNTSWAAARIRIIVTEGPTGIRKIRIIAMKTGWIGNRADTPQNRP